jgi:hypothetical protein
VKRPASWCALQFNAVAGVMTAISARPRGARRNPACVRRLPNAALHFGAASELQAKFGRANLLSALPRASTVPAGHHTAPARAIEAAKAQVRCRAPRQGMKDLLVRYGLAYRFLSTVFHEPPAASFASLAAGNLIRGGFPALPPNEQTGLRPMEAFCASWDEAELPDLRPISTACSGQDIAVAVWESYHLSRPSPISEQTYAAPGLQETRPASGPRQCAPMTHSASSWLSWRSL